MTNLYRHFDAEGNLLYVGISLNAINRLSQHKQASGWFDDIARVDIKTLPSRKEALDAETKAIQTEAPKYNKQKRTPPPKPHVKAEEAKGQLVRRIVGFEPLYSMASASTALNIGVQKLKAMCEAGEIGSIVICRGTRRNNQGVEYEFIKRAISGWQMIEYIEHLEQTSVLVPDQEQDK